MWQLSRMREQDPHTTVTPAHVRCLPVLATHPRVRARGKSRRSNVATAVRGIALCVGAQWRQCCWRTARIRVELLFFATPPSSSGQGRRSLRSETEIRILVGAPAATRRAAQRGGPCVPGDLLVSRNRNPHAFGWCRARQSALLLPHVPAVRSVVAPCLPDAATASVLRVFPTHDTSGTSSSL